MDIWNKASEHWNDLLDTDLLTEGGITLLDDLRIHVGFRGLMLANPASTPQILEWNSLPFEDSSDFRRAEVKPLAIKLDRMSLGPMVYGEGKVNGGFLKAEVSIFDNRDPFFEGK